MKGTLAEMKKASEPNREADYWDERQAIRQDQDELVTIESDMEALNKTFDQKKKDFALVDASVRKAGSDLVLLRSEVERLDKVHTETQSLISAFNEQRFKVDDVRTRLNDCMILVNVKKRRHEVEAFSAQLAILKDEFHEAIVTDDAYEGSAESEAEIKSAIDKIKPKMAAFEKTEKEFYVYLTTKLEIWTIQDCLDIETQEKKVAMLSAFRDRIAEQVELLKSTSGDVNDLNALLFRQNMANALNLFVKKTAKLRERALAVEELFKKIKKAGQDMDGNHTDDEIDFVEALAEEMPTVD